MAFVAGLNNPCVTRLKWTRQRVRKRRLDDLANLEKLMNMESAYHNYREAIKACTPPCIPYLCVSLPLRLCVQRLGLTALQWRVFDRPCVH